MREEGPAKIFESPEGKRIRQKREMATLAIELAEGGKVFPFPGIDATAYAKMKADEEDLIGYVTPIDTVLERFRTEGIKIVPGATPETGNVYVVPGKSGETTNDTRNDSLVPKQLEIIEGMDEQLKQLILMEKELELPLILKP